MRSPIWRLSTLWLAAEYKLVQWWRHFIMLPQQHVVTGSKQTNQGMNRMIAQVKQ